MYGKGTLAATGVGLTILGYEMSLSLFAAIVVLAIVGGALVYRHANRHKRYGQPTAATVRSTQETWGNDS